MQFWFRVLSALVFFSCTAAYAGQLYKIVDENGNVTFSQFPPKPSNTNSKLSIEAKSVDVQGETRVETKGVTDYCGDIKLPSRHTYKNNFYSTVARNEKRWKNNLENQEKRMRQQQERYLKSTQSRYSSKYNNSANFLKNNKQMLGNINNLKCAIKWAKSQKAETDIAFDEMNAEVKRLRNSLTTVRNQQLRACGSEPTYDPGVRGNSEKIRLWKHCSHQYSRDIRKLENLISKESRKLEQF